jgi:hypothetical protein
MNLSKLNIEQLVKLRTNLILEGKDISDINLLIDRKEAEYINYIFEDGATGGPAGSAGAASIGIGGGGVAFSNASTSGMGDVISSQPSNNTGVTTEPGYTNGGGKTGSGDVSSNLRRKVDNRKGTSKRRKNKILAGLKSALSNRQDFTAGQGKDRPKRVMNFDNFTKDQTNVVKK